MPSASHAPTHMEGDMKELILVRHGEADHLVRGLTGGWSDVHLTALGQEQARLTGSRLAGMIGDRPVQFYSSDLARTVETAEEIAKFLPVKPVLTLGLRELNNGEAASLTKEEAAKMEIPITSPVIDWAPYPGAESWRRMSERVAAFLESVDPMHDLTLLVGHGNSGNCVLHWWLGLGHGGKGIAFDLDPCSITYLRINEWGERSIVKLNDTSHLLNT